VGAGQAGRDRRGRPHAEATEGTGVDEAARLVCRDQLARVADEVAAVADDDGVISAVGFVAVGGRRVCVEHADALESCVYHVSAVLAAIGDRVARGQPVALIGMTGVTTGPHVHWEVKQAGRIIDPLAR